VAANGGGAVSVSYAFSKASGESALDNLLTQKGVVYLPGDSPVPSASPNVVPGGGPASCAIPCHGEAAWAISKVRLCGIGDPLKAPAAAPASTSPAPLISPGQEHRRKLAGHSRRLVRRRPIYRGVDLRHEPFGLARHRWDQRFHSGMGGHRQRGGLVQQLHGSRARPNLCKCILIRRSSQRVHGQHLRCVQHRTRLRGPPGHQRLGILVRGGQPARLASQNLTQKPRSTRNG